MGKTGKRCVRIGKVRSIGYEETAIKEKRRLKVKGKLRDRATVDDGGFKNKKETVRKVKRQGNSDDWKKSTKTKKRIAEKEIPDSNPSESDSGSCRITRC